MAKREIVQTFEAVFENDEDGGVHVYVYVPALKGCHSWGATRAEAREHIKEAIELWLESARDLGEFPRRHERGSPEGAAPLWRGFKGVSPLTATIIDGRAIAEQVRAEHEA